VRFPCRLILKELLHRWVGFTLSLVAATTAVGLCVGIAMTQAAAEKETRRNARDIGSNIFIIPARCDLYEYHQQGYSPHAMPDSSIDRMLGAGKIAYNHLIPTLTAEIQVKDRQARLTGIAMARHPKGRPSKSKMGIVVQPGHLHLGHGVAALLGVEKGEEIELLDRRWTIERVAPEMGTADDITILANLEDAQQALHREGEISEIKAISCVQCDTPEDTSLGTLRAQLKKILPETQVYLMKEIADARVRQRRMMETYSPFVMLLLILASGAWLGVLAAINVRERIGEIGLLRALGYGGGTIGFLILGRALLVGLLAAILGFAIGTSMTLTFGPEMFPVTSGAIRSDFHLLAFAAMAAPLIALLASFIPAAWAIGRDPAVTLREGQ
jgi:putative ABC transport system permease protein